MNTRRHLSTTNNERYYHIEGDLKDKNSSYTMDRRATVYFRQTTNRDEAIEGQDWEASFARCHVNDQFCKARGRTAARRKFFSGKKVKIAGTPSYEKALEVAGLEN